MGTYPLEAPHQNAEAGGVQEIDLLHVDDEVVAPRRDQVDELLTQLRSGVDVDLAAHLDNGVVVLSLGRQ